MRCTPHLGSTGCPRDLRLTRIKIELHVNTTNGNSWMIGTPLGRTGLMISIVFCVAFSIVSSDGNGLAEEPIKADLPPGKLGEMIRLGEAIVERTVEHPLSKSFVGNKLNCTSCHLRNGQHEKAATFLRTATAYPAWAPREERVITLEDRVLNCFMRSCNGTRPPLGSEVSVAVTTYITWLSRGEKIQQNANRPLGPGAILPLETKAAQGNRERGEQLYRQRCAECHGADGMGDEVNPPVWGSASYNDGAGLANSDHLAAWLKVAMPLDDESLSEQEAVDIAVFVNSKARPRFQLEEHLPPAHNLGRYNGKRETAAPPNNP